MRRALLLLLTGLLACSHQVTPSPHYMLGAPYQADGVWYYPREDFALQATGLATVYGAAHPDLTADGEAFDQSALAAAHQTVQLPAIARITNLENGRQVVVRINDRGPATPHRMLEVTRRTATLLGFPPDDVARVRVEVLADQSQAAVDAVPGAPSLQIAAAPLVEVMQTDLPAARPSCAGGGGRDADGRRDQCDHVRCAPVASAGSGRRRARRSPGTLYVELSEFQNFQYANMQRARVAALGANVVSRSRERGAGLSRADRSAHQCAAGRLCAGPGARRGSNRCADRGGDRTSLTMLTRRSALLASACLIGAALPAAAQPRHPPPTPRAAGGHGKKDQAAMPTDPANTPIGPVDTAARWAYHRTTTPARRCWTRTRTMQMPPSSMTKLMTIYLVYARLKTGQLKLTDRCRSARRPGAWAARRCSSRSARTVAVEDLIRGMIVDSGNDACIVLAEGDRRLGGAVRRDDEREGQEARPDQLAFTRTARGWPDPDQYMSARDIATLARHIITDFPQYYHYDSEKTFKYNNIEQGNRNPLVQHGTADGLKTGHTEAGGYGLVASTLRGGRRVILVLNGMATMRERAEEGERLMDWAFANFEDVTLFTAGDVVERAPVWLGTSPTVPLVGGRDLV